MDRLRFPLLALCLIPLARGPLFADEAAGAPGHSLHGEAFDDGPRQQAWRMSGMGDVHFPVTAAGPEAQAFFDQGVAQLHTFYYFEAERSFRQAALLDPKCAMAHWGMAMANANNDRRARGFLEKAKGLAGPATDRERKYLDALSALLDEGRKDSERREGYVKGLEAVVLAYPDDIEAKAFLVWAVMGGRVSSRVSVNTLIEEVLRRSPLHPGANHYRIHLWDGSDPAQALESALAYARAAPGIAHAWHMPGHIFNGLSRWKEAAYQQEASAHVDHAHLFQHSLMPFQIHNYAHNSHYLIANLNHLGHVRDAVAFSRNLVETPRDPQKNDRSNGGSAQRLGRFSLMRTYVRYERWDDLLSDPFLDWSDLPEEQGWKAYSRALAFLEKGDRARAGEETERLERLAAKAQKTPGREADLIETMRLEVVGRTRVRDGKLLEGFDLLEKGARNQIEKFHGDLSGYPRPFREALAFAHLEARDWGLAEACFRAVLEERKNTLVSLMGLVEACSGAGKKKEAAEAYQLFLSAWREADQDLPCLKRLGPLAASLAREGALPADALAVAGAAGRAAPAGGAPAASASPPAPAGKLPAPGAASPAPPAVKAATASSGALAAGKAPAAGGPGGDASAAATAASREPAREVTPVDLDSLGPKLWRPSPAPDFTLQDSKGSEVRLRDFRGRNVLLVFSLGGSCPHCLEQLQLLGREKGALDALDTQVLAVSDEPREKVRELLAGPSGSALTFPFLHDPARRVARLYQAHDTFEDLALHGAILIDRQGKVRWSRIGSEPFTDLAFLKGEVERVNKLLSMEL